MSSTASPELLCLTPPPRAGRATTPGAPFKYSVDDSDSVFDLSTPPVILNPDAIQPHPDPDESEEEPVTKRRRTDQEGEGEATEEAEDSADAPVVPTGAAMWLFDFPAMDDLTCGEEFNDQACAGSDRIARLERRSNELAARAYQMNGRSQNLHGRVSVIEEDFCPSVLEALQAFDKRLRVQQETIEALSAENELLHSMMAKAKNERMQSIPDLD